ncbi:ATP-utilizing phosphoenolpyruvate carboxykinase [Aureobasidium pullulans]|uniref:Phosphoenolpyruvate carboxykinase (ATP) n=1 Tax=Aureobasidium pullulans TaxID=5580 RepID=A0A4T0B6X8_AURPU|nr:ATP-utilizing phosphoenolpyruvate carboxykinase [Aureobasidium pullulans]
MVADSVNKTALHPGGVQPQREHTEIEEELHEKAHIDYDRVAIVANPSVAALYEDALVYETGSAITSSGALSAYSGAKTGRSPSDKRIVREPSSEKEIWWGPVNKEMSPDVWKINRERAVDYLNTRNRIYVIDGYAGWDERYRIRVRVVCARAYHALFMRNMLIRPSREELKTFHPDYVIYNAGAFPANRFTTGMTSATSVAINFAEKEMVILGTEYAGEMKKGVFTVLFYEMPVKHNVRLGEMRHVKWGFIFYRCTYSDESSWQRFMNIVRHRAELDIHETGGGTKAITSSLEISSFEDGSKFEGATIDQIREHFENWVCDSSRSILQEQGPDANPYPTARYTYPIHVDAEAMYSVVESAPQPPARDKDGIGYVNLINSYWRPQEPSSQCDEELHERDGNDDVGYMRTAA